MTFSPFPGFWERQTFITPIFPVSLCSVLSLFSPNVSLIKVFIFSPIPLLFSSFVCDGFFASARTNPFAMFWHFTHALIESTAWGSAVVPISRVEGDATKCISSLFASMM